MNIRQLARHQVLLGEEELLCDIQELADRVVQASGIGGNVAQRRVVSMMVNYATRRHHTIVYGIFDQENCWYVWQYVVFFDGTVSRLEPTTRS